MPKLASERAVERETARKWLARSLACWRRHRASGEERWRDLARDYEHEALEHAALVKDYGRFVGTMQKKLERAARGR